jgi:hypothetical protein
MSENILDSYLVKLGAAVDDGSWRKFAVVIRGAEKSVESFTGLSARMFLKFEVAAIGAFVAVGTGLIALADKTAMADQQYRLFGLRMLMSKDTARAFQMSLDELGATIDQVAFDPELNRRFQYLYQQNLRLGHALGQNFDDNMIKIRDIRMEFKLLSNGLEILAAGSVSKLFEKLGYGSGDLENKLRQLNEWFINNLPQLADRVSDDLIPVWRGFTGEVKEAWEIIKELGHDFTYTVGVLKGDKSLQTSTTDFSQFAKAVADSAEWLSKFIDLTLRGTRAVIGLGEAIVYGLKQHKLPDFTQHVGKDGKTTFDLWHTGGDDALSKRFDDILNKPLGLNSAVPSSQNVAKDYDLQQLIISASRKYNLNPDLLSALISQESNYKPGAISKAGAQGLTQLMPDTAKQYGVDNPFDASQNIEGGAHYLADLLKRYNNNIASALAAYNEGQGNFDKYGISPKNIETRDYVDSVIRKFTSFYEQSRSAGTPVHIDSVTINVPKNLPQEQWHSFIKESMKDIIGDANSKTMAQTAGGAYQ